MRLQQKFFVLSCGLIFLASQTALAQFPFHTSDWNRGVGQSAQPIWSVYTPSSVARRNAYVPTMPRCVSPVPFFGPVVQQQVPALLPPQNFAPQIFGEQFASEPLTYETPVALNPPADNFAPADSPDQSFEPLLNKLEFSLDGWTEGEPLEIYGEVVSDSMNDGNIEGSKMDSPGVGLDLDGSANKNTDELARMRQQVAELVAANKDSKKTIAQLETKLSGNAQAASQVAKIKKGLEKTKAEMAKYKQQVAKEKRRMQKKLEMAEAKLAESGQKPGKKKKKAKDDSEQKKARQDKPAKDAASNKLEKKKNKGSQEDQLNAQIDRAVSKIKKRFAGKIEPLVEKGGAEEKVESLRAEMKVQIDKMEERIRNRFKNKK